MTILLGILTFLYGISIGSFLNVCIYRMPLNESVVTGSSHCVKCNKKIKYYDLIPLLSYILLKGRCRFCDKKISIRYPIIELVNGILYLIVFSRFGLSMDLIFYSLLSSILLAISVIDYEHKIIPNRLVFVAFILGVIYHIFFGGLSGLISSVIGFFAVSILLYLIAIVSKGGMGGGDIKMMAAFGFCLGWQLIVLSLIVGSLIGSILAIYLLVFKNYTGKTQVPFGPFLASGIFISIIYGNSIIGWYLGMLKI